MSYKQICMTGVGACLAVWWLALNGFLNLHEANHTFLSISLKAQYLSLIVAAVIVLFWNERRRRDHRIQYLALGYAATLGIFGMVVGAALSLRTLS